jgi:hypothetical protein
MEFSGTKEMTASGDQEQNVTANMSAPRLEVSL